MTFDQSPVITPAPLVMSVKTPVIIRAGRLIIPSRRGQIVGGVVRGARGQTVEILCVVPGVSVAVARSVTLL